MKPPPKYTPPKTCPPKVVVGLDGVKRLIVYAVTGEVVRKKVIHDPHADRSVPLSQFHSRSET